MSDLGLHVAIIGGGFSGAALARQLADRKLASISVFEPRQDLGRGLAYDSEDPVHRINVPAAKMSLFSDDPESFIRYLAQHPPQDRALIAPSGDPYPQRKIFGDYVGAQIAPYLKSGQVKHHRAKVIAAKWQGSQWSLQDEFGQSYKADLLVLATSHPPPSLPGVFAPVADAPGLFAEGAAHRDFSRISQDARVLVVGNGLTAADVIASLERQGHRGAITALSRRGLRSKGHAAQQEEANVSFLPAPRSALLLLRQIRAEVARAKSQGQSWHAIFDQLRAEGQQIWQALPLESRRQISRHLRPFWDVHRFRIAPQVEEVLDRATQEGRLVSLAARLKSARVLGDQLEITYQRRRSQEVETALYDAVIVTTGPAHGAILRSQSLLAQLAQDGHLTLCPTGLGLSCDRQSRAIGRDGQRAPALFISGPLARGTFGELMGLPQVADHAAFLAEEIIAFSRAVRPVSKVPTKVLT